MKKFTYVAIALAITLVPQVALAQDLNLTPGANSLKKSLEDLFLIIAAIGFLIVGYKQMHNFKPEGDTWEGIKVLVVYILVFLAIIGAYKFITSQTL